MVKRILNILKEPFVLFIGLGVILFFLYTQLTQLLDLRDKQIVVSPAQVEMMAMTFEKTWNRPPTESEMEAQLENYVMDEVFFKEAVAMGLDKTDPAVKRRLRTLMEMMMEDLSAVYPSEEQLNDYLRSNPEKFREDPIISFQHLYFTEDDREAAEQQHKNLNMGLAVHESTLGNLSMIPRAFKEETYFQVNRILGEEFTQRVFEAEPGQWVGPLHSAYGWHLVYVTEIVPGYVPELADIWDEVEREWSVERKKEKKAAQYQKMKAKYEIRFETVD